MIRFSRAAVIAATVLTLSGCAQVKAFLPGNKDESPAAAPAVNAPGSEPEAAPKRSWFSNPFDRKPRSEKPAKAPKAEKPPMPGNGDADARSPLKLPPGVWPQAISDVAPDPNFRFGALPNGMRYAIVKNATPPGQAALRLRFDAGSLFETDQQQGLAHFLEHMAFNGSKAIPEGEMVKILERHGLAFGADTNASTNFDETVYKLDLPQTDAATVDAAIQMLRETAGELLIEQGAVDRERGVVLSEERSRDSPGYRLYKQRMAFMMKGQRPPLRYPIGEVEVLKTAGRDQIVDFYDKYYRPERATFVAVGDFDPDVMEARIKAAFSDWKARAPDGPEPPMGPIAKRGPEALVAVEAGAPTAIQMTWVQPPELQADSTAKRRQDLIEQLGFAVLNRRLGSLGRSADAPFISAGAFKGDLLHAAEFTSIAITAKGGAWGPALSAVEQEQRRAVQYGVRQEELDREIEEYRSFFKSRVAGAATRRTPSLAGEILSSLGDSEVVTSPAQDLALFDEAVNDLRAATVSASLKAAFRGQGPLLFVSSSTAIEGAETAVLAAWEASTKLPVKAGQAATNIAWPYESFGEPGKVVETRDLVDIDATLVRFANGVRLTVKPTKFRDDQILVRVRIGDGLLGQPADRQNLAWAGSALVEGGLGKISTEDMERVLASKQYDAGFAIDEDALVLTGATRPEDMDTQMQVLAAYATDAGWRPEAFQRMKTYAATLDEQYRATDSGVLGRELPGLLHAGDRRWTWPSPREISATTLDDLKAQIAPALATGQIEVVIVGDITVDKAIEATAQTFGALAARPEAAPIPDTARVVGFPAPVAAPVALTHNGRADQAIAFIAWKTDDFFSNVQRARNTAMMAKIMDLRLIDELREKQGATYSPNVDYNHSSVWTGWGYVYASVEVPPAMIDGFFRDTLKIAADLQGAPPSADEMDRARKPYLEAIAKSQSTNEYWLGQLAGAQTDPRRLAAARSALAGIERVTPADVQAAARQFLDEGKAWRLVVQPSEKTK
jgi:zinc protease